MQERPERVLDLVAMSSRIKAELGFDITIVEKPLFCREFPVLSLARV